MNRLCPQFYRFVRQGMTALLSVNPGHTGRVVITVHCKDGVPLTVAVDAPDVPRRWEEVTD